MEDYDVALGEQRLNEREKQLQEWADRLRRLSVTLEVRTADVEQREKRMLDMDKLLSGIAFGVDELAYRQLRNHSDKLIRVAEELNKISAAAHHRSNKALIELEKKKHGKA